MVVGVLAGLFWFQAGAGELTTQSALDVGGLLFFEVLFLAFSSLFQAIFNYPPEFSMVVKERQSGMYRLRCVCCCGGILMAHTYICCCRTGCAQDDMGTAAAAFCTGAMNEQCKSYQLRTLQA